MIIFVLLISLIGRVWYTLQNTILFWDTAMYVGIGKYIYSGGQIGIFEPFRPILFPLILGGVWKLGMDPIVVGKIIALTASLGLIYTCYRIGEMTRKNAGLYAAILIGFSPVVLAFSNAPLTDIPSAALTVWAAYLFLKRKDLASGFVVALAFLTRFPQALIGIVFGLSLVVFLVQKTITLKDFVHRCIRLALGFAILAVPFFIANWYYYGDPLHPIKVANIVVANSVHYNAFSYFFYIKGLLLQNPFIIFALGGLMLFFKKFKDSKAAPAVIVSGIAVVIIGGYFSHSIHQELRYGISFLPYITIIAGYIIARIASDTKITFKQSHNVIAIILMLSLSGISYYAYNSMAQKYILTPAQVTYFSYFKDKGQIELFTSSPQFVALADTKISRVIDTWEHTAEVYPKGRLEMDYIAFNDCETICQTEGAACQNLKETFISQVESTEQEVFKGDSQYCKIRIYKVNK